MTSLHPPTDTATTTPTTTDTNTQTSAIKTHHCRFCNHLLLATTRHLPSLPRRKEPARDAALILPLPVSGATEDEEEQDEAEEDEKEVEGQEGNGTTQNQRKSKTKPQKQKGKDYSILLSTTLPDRKPTLIRREDGFEKRLLLRCGRCRVGIGYFLDPVHFPDSNNGEEDGDGDAKVVYLLPGALVETGVMVRGDEGTMKAMDQEWTGWT